MIKHFHSKYLFTTENPPQNYSKTYEAFLYNRERHLSLQSSLARLSCYLLRPDKSAVKAEVHFFIQDGQAISGIKSPFGSLCYDNKISSEVLYAFVDYILTVLKTHKISGLRLKSYAQVYSAQQSARLMNVLINKGFELQEASLNLHLPVSEKPFEEWLHKMEMRKLGRGRHQNWQFQQEPMGSLEECYAFIEKCRISRKQEVSIGLGILKQTFEAFPKHFRIFSIRNQGQLVALTILVRAGRKIWYNFQPASDPAFHHLSPMVYLLEQVYQFCQKQKAEVLDLGTSEINKIPLFGLQTFKRRLGAISTIKPTYYLAL